jgi:hypothetical protein
MLWVVLQMIDRHFPETGNCVLNDNESRSNIDIMAAQHRGITHYWQTSSGPLESLNQPSKDAPPLPQARPVASALRKTKNAPDRYDDEARTKNTQRSR